MHSLIRSELEEAKCEAVILALKDLGANVDAQNIDGETAAYLAAQNGYVKILKSLKAVDANLDIGDNYGETPLHSVIRAEFNDEEYREAVIQALKDLGADIDARNIYGETPAFVAIESEDTDSLELLHRLGANLHITSFNGQTLTLLAVWEEDLDALNLLQKFEALDLSTADNEGATPGFYAGESRDTEVITWLHEAGANLSIPNAEGAISAHTAAAEGNINALQLLQQLGVDLNHQNHFGITPVFLALKAGHVDIFLFLASAGAAKAIPICSETMEALVTDQNEEIKARSNQWLNDNNQNTISVFEFIKIIGNKELINLFPLQTPSSPSASVLSSSSSSFSSQRSSPRFFGGAQPSTPKQSTTRELDRSGDQPHSQSEDRYSANGMN